MEEYASLMVGKLPTWLPEGFGFMQGYGPAYGGYAYGVWADGTCREIALYASDVAARVPDGPRVGQWTVTADVPDSCGNNVMGTGTCLSYTAVVAGGTYHLQMMGIDREEGDRIARSFPLSVPFDGI